MEVRATPPPSSSLHWRALPTYSQAITLVTFWRRFFGHQIDITNGDNFPTTTHMYLLIGNDQRMSQLTMKRLSAPSRSRWPVNSSRFHERLRLILSRVRTSNPSLFRTGSMRPNVFEYGNGSFRERSNFPRI